MAVMTSHATEEYDILKVDVNASKKMSQKNVHVNCTACLMDKDNYRRLRRIV
jgi:hypothetical protein